MSRRELREELIAALRKCSERQQHRFKQMYAFGRLNDPMEAVINDMPDDKLDWAMEQVQKTLDKQQEKQ